MNPPQYFTIEEANEIVRQIRPMIKKILEIRLEIMDRRPDVWPAMVKMAGNGGNRAASEVEKDFSRLRDLLHQVLATGAQLKDVNSGLVDFLSLRNGQEVLLCWRYGEDAIQFWHGLDAGFAGRQPL
jgi:hypothetical protein